MNRAAGFPQVCLLLFQLCIPGKLLFQNYPLPLCLFRLRKKHPCLLRSGLNGLLPLFCLFQVLLHGLFLTLPFCPGSCIPQLLSHCIQLLLRLVQTFR